MIIKERFQFLKGYQNNHVTIGFGSYGQVKLARDLSNGSIVAMKVMHKIAKNEVMVHWTLSHPKIIKLIDVHIDTERQITYMILEYAEDGTLYQKIKTGSLTKKEAKKYFKDVCEGLAYLHSHNIMHRDIKPQNVLLTKKGEAKLCDFGFAAMLGERKTLCGTYQYMSPEMIQNRPYDYKVDVWALGILFFELLAGHAPFRGNSSEEVLEQMKTKIYFCQTFDVEDINLVKSILRATPNKRPTVEEILKQLAIDSKFQSNESTNGSNEGSEQKNLHFLTKSWSPRKMVEIAKIFSNESQKKTYPPFVPKFQKKMNPGISSSFNVASPQKSSPIESTAKLQFNLENAQYASSLKMSPMSKVVSSATFMGFVPSPKGLLSRERPTSNHIQSMNQIKMLFPNGTEFKQQE